MKPEDTKARILAASDALFGELGFDATSTRDIALRSGVNKALIHYHFHTKDDLLAVLLDGYYQELTATLVAALGKRATPAAQLGDVLDAYADFLAGHRTFCSLVQREIASGHHVEELVRRTLPGFRLATTWLRRQGAGAASGLELLHVLTTVYGMVITYFTYGRVLHQLSGVDPFAPAALAERKRHVRRVATLLFRELRRSPPGPKGTPWPRSIRTTPRRSTAS